MSADNADFLDPDGWTNIRKDNPYEIYEEKTWEIYDPCEARTVAVFNDEAAARAYLHALNKKRDSD